MKLREQYLKEPDFAFKQKRAEYYNKIGAKKVIFDENNNPYVKLKLSKDEENDLIKSVTIDIPKDVKEKLEDAFDVKEILDAVLEQTLTQEKCPYEAQVNLLITDDEGIREFNRQFRQVDSPTDVLSFPMIPFEREADFSIVEAEEADCFDPDSGELLLGDIIISAQKVLEQAEKYGHSTKREFAFLTAHSMLHLCGYDHMEQEQAKAMEQKQEQILVRLGITRED